MRCLWRTPAATAVARAADPFDKSQVLSNGQRWHATNGRINLSAHSKAGAGMVGVPRPRIVRYGVQQRGQAIHQLGVVEMPLGAADKTWTELGLFARVADNKSAYKIRTLADYAEVGINPITPRNRVGIRREQKRSLGPETKSGFHRQTPRRTHMRELWGKLNGDHV